MTSSSPIDTRDSSRLLASATADLEQLATHNHELFAPILSLLHDAAPLPPPAQLELVSRCVYDLEGLRGRYQTATPPHGKLQAFLQILTPEVTRWFVEQWRGILLTEVRETDQAIYQHSWWIALYFVLSMVPFAGQSMRLRRQCFRLHEAIVAAHKTYLAGASVLLRESCLPRDVAASILSNEVYGGGYTPKQVDELVLPPAAKA
jgi:hypothetical protein